MLPSILGIDIFMTSYRKEASYHPLNDPVYMSPQMKQFFQRLLYDELQKLTAQEHSSSAIAFEDVRLQPDSIDQSTTENLRLNHHAFHEHEKMLCRQVELALRRLACGNYGYCVVTGKPIGVKRLIAAPYTAYCLDAQEEKEQQDKELEKYLPSLSFKHEEQHPYS